MTVDSWTKLVVVVMVCVAAIFLGDAGKIESQAVVALLSACLGYVFGNGHGILSAAKTIQQITAGANVQPAPAPAPVQNPGDQAGNKS